jgi:hypothetical protein
MGVSNAREGSRTLQPSLYPGSANSDTAAHFLPELRCVGIRGFA